MAGMAARKVRFGIAAKAVTFVTLVLAMSMAVIVSVTLSANRKALLDETVERAAGLSYAAIALSRADILAGRADELSGMLDEFANRPEIAYVFSVSADGRVLAGHSEDVTTSADTAIDSLTTAAWSNAQEVSDVRDGVLHMAIPVESDGRVHSVLRTGFALDHISAHITRMGRRVVILGLCVFLVIAPLTALAVSVLVRPIRAVTEAAQKITRREFDLDLKVHTNDELQVLAEALNGMAVQVRGFIARIRQLAFIDELTKLPNKTGFLEHARRILADSDMPSAALLIDLDRFKRLNDIYGPREGDKLLAAAAQRMHAAAKRVAERYRHPDARPPLLARLSGDEYALLMCGPSPTSAAKEVAREILDSLHEPFAINEGEAMLSASIGIARAPIDGREIEELMRLANLALDGIKADGGDDFRFFETEMTRRALERMNLENELRRAIANNEFVVHYQPKVDARTGALTGCEALVRWRRDGDIVGPGAFIEAAEDCGLISEIGDFVLEEACAAAARWREAGHECCVAVNVSATQFEIGGFAERVLDVLERTGLPPSLLELELTETVAMNNPDQVIRQVEPIREKGVRFAIDDFGTGHSSLASLTRMPFDTFKIDQSFVRQMETEPSARVVVETIIAMARALGYETVGEGVETPTQFAFLRLNGCTTAQGWYFGKPAPEEEFVKRLAADRQTADANTPTVTAPKLRNAV